MKIVILLLMMFFGVSSAQDQNFTFSDDSFTYLVRINDDVAIGETAFGFNTYYGSRVDYESPVSITEYEYVGMDSSGTIHLIKDDHNYTLESEERSNLLVTSNKTFTFYGNLKSPDLEISIQEAEGGKVSVTLINAEAFEAFTE